MNFYKLELLLFAISSYIFLIASTTRSAAQLYKALLKNANALSLFTRHVGAAIIQLFTMLNSNSLADYIDGRSGPESDLVMSILDFSDYFAFL